MAGLDGVQRVDARLGGDRDQLGGDRRVIGVYAFLQMLLPAAGFAVATLVPALLFRRRRALRI